MICKTQYILPAIMLFIVASLFTSCDKAVDPSFLDSPVVEGYLTAGDYLHIKISRQTSTSPTVVYSADDRNALDITVTADGVDYKLSPVGDGVYENRNVTVKEGATYSLSFLFNNKQITAKTVIPSKPADFAQSVTSITLQKVDSTTTFTPGSFTMADPVVLTWTNTDKSYYLIVATDTVTNPELVRDTTNRPTFNFRSTPATTAEEQLRSMQFQYFGTYQIVLYHLNPDYATLYDQSSTSSQNLTSPSTGITNGFGIFTGMNSDTLFLNVIKQ